MSDELEFLLPLFSILWMLYLVYCVTHLDWLHL